MTLKFDTTNLSIQAEQIYANRHKARYSREGRAWLRERGDVSKGAHDMTSRPFVGWDGEGITHGPDGIPQSYCLFGASTGDYILSAQQLTSSQCLELMLKVQYNNPDAIHVGFAIGYDGEMMMAHMPIKVIQRLAKHTVARWGKYRIEFIPKKWFQVTGEYLGKKVTCKIWDVWSFFATSFVKAIDSYLDIPAETLTKIREGKALRGNFTTGQLHKLIKPYWKMELKFLVQLMDKLRTLLNGAGLYPTQWHGPAALANCLFKTHGIAAHMNHDTPPEVLDAEQYAYAAGRVEACMVGRLWSPVYKYDLNSAYPFAMVECPSLAKRRWTARRFYASSTDGYDADSLGIQQYAMYFVHFKSPRMYSDIVPMPFFHRSKNAYISFPHQTVGWYWGPEVRQAMAWDRDSVHLIAGWELDLDGAEYPFEYIRGEFAKRLKMKADGDESERAVKLGLNSGYGKLAQRSGYDRFQQIPKWHQYGWAGYITSRTRATMHSAAMLAARRGSLIGIETDAVFSSEPLPELETGKQLGQWGLETYPDIIYLQSGVYWLKTDKEWSDELAWQGYQRDETGAVWAAKFRGMDADTLTVDGAMTYLDGMSMNVASPKDYQTQAMKGMTRTRFVGFKAANHRNRLDTWRSWVTDDVTLSIGGSFKRVHIPNECSSCQNGVHYASNTMHDLAVMDTGIVDGAMSHASKLPWREVPGYQSPIWEDINPDEILDNLDPSFGI